MGTFLGVRKTELSRDSLDEGEAVPALHAPAVRKLLETMVKRLLELRCNQHRQQVEHSRVLHFTATLFSISNSVPLLRPFQISIFVKDALQR